MRTIGRFLILGAVIPALFLGIGCNKSKKKSPWLLLAAGAKDLNGVLLPGSSGGGAIQEVPTHGPATITGNIEVTYKDGANTDVCGQGGDPGSCLDLSTIVVHLIDGDGNPIATVNADEDGNFQFDIDDLENNNYRVLIESDKGLNYAYQDFSFTFDPTVTGPNLVDAGTLKAERKYYDSGHAIITGNVKTDGYDDGDVSISAGNLEGITVTLRDNDGNVLYTTTTDSSGNYSFDIPDLNNGNYILGYEGSSKIVDGQPFEDIANTIHYTFKGNDPDIATEVDLSTTTLSWLAATSGSLALNGAVLNAAVSGDTSTLFTIALKNEQGNIIKSTTQTGVGSFNISPPGVLNNGVYYVEVSAPNFVTASQSFLFTAKANGGSKTVTMGPIGIVALPSNVVGFVEDSVSHAHVSGSVINFRPDATQPPSNLAYLLTNPDLGNAMRLWILQSMSGVAGKDCSNPANYGDSICSCAIQPTFACLVSRQGNGPWNYSTWGNKVYEVNQSNKQVYFTAVAGKWAYYVSAPGYENYCASNPVPCSSNSLSITLNGHDENAGTLVMQSIAKRSQIAGSISVRDTSLQANPFANLSSLFVVLLGNTDSTGKALAHIAPTVAGAFDFNGSSFVVTLPSNLSSDAQRVGYALGEVKKLSLGMPSAALPLANASNIAKHNDANASIDVRDNSEYNFRQSSYQIVVVDTTAPTDRNSYLATTSLGLDTSSAATNTYEDTPVTANLVGLAAHAPRATISGTVTDAISTAAVSGATLTLGRYDSNNNFVADVRRDCSGSFNNNSCSLPTLRQSGKDQQIGDLNSDASGKYSFKYLPVDSYVLRVSKNGIDTFFPVEVDPTGGEVVVNTPIITNNGRGHLTGSVKTPGGFNFTGTYSLEVVDANTGSTRPTAGVNPASISTGATNFTNAPQYNIFNINAGRWKIRFTAPNYKTVEGIVDIQADATTSFDIITFIPGTQNPAAISGRALSALNNTGVCQLTARIRPGVNVKSGPYAIDKNGNTIAAVTTANDGSYAIPNVPAGNYTLEVSGSGKDRNCTSVQDPYATTYKTVISAGNETPSNQNILVSPKLSTNEMRIVLSWGANPRDLDSHLQYKSTEKSGQPGQFVWNNKSPLGLANGSLDFDIVTGYGPETVTLKGNIWSQDMRNYSVYNWTGSPAMGTSGAVVRVFKGEAGEVRSYAIPPNFTNRWWKLFCVSPTGIITDAGNAGCAINSTNFFDKHYYGY
ncbi:MAG: Cna protein B-type domain protein [Leptonema sp. (in: Bacteria)]|nr:Cna protein B-type domain protein [Leptonema sp. (in: bacteria)]